MTNQNGINPSLLSGKVAAILNERELVINIGAGSGVRLGIKFKVLSDQPTDIYDPDTKEKIGVLDREKVRVKVVDVQENLSVCRTYKTYSAGGSPLFLFRDLVGEPARRIPETLKAKDSSYIPPLSEEESYVKITDRVIQITDADD